MKNLILMSLVSLTLVACSGGGNGGGAPGYTHNELAANFVNNLNLDAEFSVSLVKRSTLQSDYIVIYDPYTDTYDAINIDLYSPNTDAAAYYYNNMSVSYFDLDVIPSHYELEYNYEFIGYDYYGDAVYDYVGYEVLVPTRYRDRYSNITFEKTASTPKDLAKMAALTEVAKLDKKAKFLSSEFGLSLSRSKEVSRLVSHWEKASQKGMTDAELDSFSTELLGFSITAGKQAAQSYIEGNTNSLNSLINSAAKVNGVTPEHATKLMNNVLSLQ
mgnify:CR=1 FL=1